MDNMIYFRLILCVCLYIEEVFHCVISHLPF